MDEESLLSFYKQHVTQVLIPFWLDAVDYKYGGIYTCFNNRGDKLVSKDKYVWSQGRFLWIWSNIVRMILEDTLKGEPEPYLNQLQLSVRFIEDNVFLENGSCAFLVSETGKKKESTPGKEYHTSIYADCFIVLGMAAYAGLTNDLKRFEKALNLYENITHRLRTNNIPSEPYPIPDGYRAHSIPMIMLNITQELVDTAKVLNHRREEELCQYAIEYMDDIMNNFYCKNSRIIEMLPFSSPKENTLLCRHTNPGHTIESMWFVMDTAQKVGNKTYIQQAMKAIDHAIDIGWDQKHGGLFRFVDKDGGKPKGKMTDTAYERLIMNSWSTKLWWPHSEALYATLQSYIIFSDKKMLSLYEKIQSYVFSTFPNPDKTVGEWIQIRNRRGKPVDKLVALPVKDPFHILRNMLLIVELLEELKTNN